MQLRENESECEELRRELDVQLRENESECKELQRELDAERSLCTHKKLECKGLQIDICTALKVTVDLWNRLEVFRVAFQRKYHCAEELTAYLAARNWSESTKLARLKN